MPEPSHREYSPHSPWPISICPPESPTYSQLSIVIAFLNQGDMTADCVESILRDEPTVEIILVDNGSDSETKQHLTRRLANVAKFVTFDSNRGCAVAWNAGLKAASGDLLAVMNNDIVAHEGGIRGLAENAWEAGISCLSSGHLDADLVCQGASDSSHGASYPEGSALFFRRDVWDEVGLFDEGMLLAYCEDSDWALRARLAGFGWRTCPGTLTHFRNKTSSSVEIVSRYHAHNQERLNLKYRGMGVGEKIVVRRTAGWET